MADHIVTDAEHEFYKAFVTILEYLKKRATRAEAEVELLQKELIVRREQIEYMAGQMPTDQMKG